MANPTIPLSVEKPMARNRDMFLWKKVKTSRRKNLKSHFNRGGFSLVFSVKNNLWSLFISTTKMLQHFLAHKHLKSYFFKNILTHALLTVIPASCSSLLLMAQCLPSLFIWMCMCILVRVCVCLWCIKSWTAATSCSCQAGNTEVLHRRGKSRYDSGPP